MKIGISKPKLPEYLTKSVNRESSKRILKFPLSIMLSTTDQSNFLTKQVVIDKRGHQLSQPTKSYDLTKSCDPLLPSQGDTVQINNSLFF